MEPKKTTTAVVEKKNTPFLPIIVGAVILLGIFLVASKLPGSKQTSPPSPQNSDAETETIAKPNLVLSMDPMQLSLKKGETGDVKLMINTNGATASGAEIHISYDPKVIAVTKFTKGTVLPTELMKEKNESGEFSVTLGAVPTSPFNGNDVLGTLTIKALSESATELTFADSTQVAVIRFPTNAVSEKTGASINK